jgi:probable rRNA maturation factor
MVRSIRIFRRFGLCNMIEINNTTKFKINEKLMKKTAEKFLVSRRLTKKDVSIALIGDAKMRQLNFKYRHRDKTTDVLSFGAPLLLKEFPSFPRRGWGGSVGGGYKEESQDFGEILINPAQIKRQAKENKNSFQDELIFILVHGLLHLAGYNDSTEKDRLKIIKIGEDFIRKSEVRRKK